MENKDKIETHFETYLSYAKENYVARVNANDLLSLENGLKEMLREVNHSLSNQWSADTKRTVREVLEHGE